MHFLLDLADLSIEHLYSLLGLLLLIQDLFSHFGLLLLDFSYLPLKLPYFFLIVQVLVLGCLQIIVLLIDFEVCFLVLLLVYDLQHPGHFLTRVCGGLKPLDI